MRNNSNSNAANADPTAIPIMAPVERFLDFLPDVEGEMGSEGDGAGEGKNGLQGGSGPPQRPRFPANEDAGYLDSVSGMEPFKLLLATLNSFKPSELMLGREPENLLFCKNNRVS